MNISVILFLESLGGGELVVILLFVLLFFGSKNIPSLARGLGSGIRQFKDAMNGVQSEIKQGMYEVEKQTNSLSLEEKARPDAATQPDASINEAPVDLTQQGLPTPQPEDRSAAR